MADDAGTTRWAPPRFLFLDQIKPQRTRTDSTLDHNDPSSHDTHFVGLPPSTQRCSQGRVSYRCSRSKSLHHPLSPYEQQGLGGACWAHSSICSPARTRSSCNQHVISTNHNTMPAPSGLHAAHSINSCVSPAVTGVGQQGAPIQPCCPCNPTHVRTNAGIGGGRCRCNLKDSHGIQHTQVTLQHQQHKAVPGNDSRLQLHATTKAAYCELSDGDILLPCTAAAVKHT